MASESGHELAAGGDVRERQPRIELLHRLLHRQGQRDRIAGRAQHEERVRHVDERKVDGPVFRRVEPGPFHVADDADDGGPGAVGAAAAPEAAAEHLCAGEEAGRPTRDRRRRRCPAASARRGGGRARGGGPTVLEEPGRGADPRADRLVLAGGVGRSSRSKLLRWPASLGGRLSASAAASTPGNARRAVLERAIPERGAVRPRSRSAGPDSETDAVSMRSVSMPTGTRFRRSRLASTSTAATSSGVASANSAATSARRASVARRTVASPSGRRPAGVRRRESREPRIAGTRPPSKISAPLPIVRMSEPAEHGADEADLVDARDVVAAVDSDELKRPAPRSPSADHRRARGQQRRSRRAGAAAGGRARRRARCGSPARGGGAARARSSRLTALAQAISSTQPTAASTKSSVRAGVADDACLQIQQAPRRLLDPGRRTSRSGNRRALVARSASVAARRRDVRAEARQRHGEERSLAPGRRPARRGEHRDAALERADAVGSSTPTTVWLDAVEQ